MAARSQVADDGRSVLNLPRLDLIARHGLFAGVPAALFMVKTMTLLRTELLKDQPIDEALRTLNDMLWEENPTCMFAALIVGILNKLTGGFRYVNEGHDALVPGEGRVAYRSLSPPRGILIGLEAGATYEVDSLTLSKNDVLVLYTDGVTEAMSPDSQLFSFDRLMECLGQRPASSAHELADRIDRAGHQFAAGAPQSDDLTTMIIRYQGA